MRILIVTAGSRGDVAPFTGLGQGLLDAGHQVAVAAHLPFAGLVAGCGLDHRPLPGDPQELIRANALATSPEEAWAVTSAFLDRLADGVVAAVGRAPTWCSPRSAPNHSARRWARRSPSPSSVPTSRLPSPRGNSRCPACRAPTTWGRTATSLLAGVLLARAGALQEGVLTRLRTRLGLPAAVGPVQAGRIRPVFHGFSPRAVPRPADWTSEVEVTGYWWPARPRGWRPLAELADFLQAGPPPVFIGFGSMAPGQGERLVELVAGAVARAGVRGGAGGVVA